MLDIGWPEFAVILFVALLVIGPRDLPKALYTAGKWMRSARKVAREFQRHVDDAMREAELDDLKKGVDQARKFSVKKQIENLVDPDDELKGAFDPNDPRARAKKAQNGAAEADKPKVESKQPAEDSGAVQPKAEEALVAPAGAPPAAPAPAAEPQK